MKNCPKCGVELKSLHTGVQTCRKCMDWKKIIENRKNFKGLISTCIECGKKTSRHSTKKCRSCSMKGKIPKNLSLINANKIGKDNPMFGKKPWNYLEDRNLVKKFNRQIGPIYNEWRMAVWTRDNFRCKICNRDCKGRIEAHHILPWKDYPELRYDVNNGITLCHFHHPRKKADVKKLSPYFQDIINKAKVGRVALMSLI